MNKEKLTLLHSWFDQYVGSFQSRDKRISANIALKREHTLRVTDIIKRIAESLYMKSSQMYLAEAIGLLHDIGRFEQYSEYRTFKDAVSEDHGSLGVKVLIGSKIMEGISQEEQRIILDSVEYHNKLDLPDNMLPDCLLFTKMIRDADKLDILDLSIKFYENRELYKHEAIEELLNIPQYQQVCIENILNGQKISFTDVKTTVDGMLARISWLYDINFKYSFQYIREKHYIERLIDVMPKTEDIKRVEKVINSYIINNMK